MNIEVKEKGFAEYIFEILNLTRTSFDYESHDPITILVSISCTTWHFKLACRT